MSALENAALLIQNGHPDLAIPIIDAELARDPQNWECHVNIGIAYRLTNKFQLAVLHQNLATQLQPENAVAWHNRGVTQTELGDFKGAFLSHQKAYTLCQTSRQMCLAYAYALMRYGKFEAAWPLWEQARNHIAALREFRIPIWDGTQSLEGKRIVVIREGGFGDSILFLRWMAELQDRGANTSFYTQENEAGIFVGHPWINHVLTDEESVSPKNFDFCASILSLPALLNCKADAIPSAERYIMARPDDVRLMREVIPRGTKPLVGICWGAEEGGVTKRSRTISDEQIEILKDADVQWISLWPGHRLPWMWDAPVRNWSDTAALITHLDAVVSVDTAVLHLSSAMGKRTIGMVPIGSDWKFFRGVSPSPWYPSLEVITNDDPVKWTGAVQKALDALTPRTQDVPSMPHAKTV